jgi:hypothetical protein
MFAKLTLTLWLVAGSLGQAGTSTHAAARVVSPPAAPSVAAPATAPSRRPGTHYDVRYTTAHGTRARHKHVHGAAARAVEHRLLLVASRSKLLARFVDRTTGLVKRNVTAHCELMRHRRPSRYACEVWQQPRPSSSGVTVICRTSRHKRFLVMAPRRRRLR